MFKIMLSSTYNELMEELLMLRRTRTFYIKETAKLEKKLKNSVPAHRNPDGTFRSTRDDD